FIGANLGVALSSRHTTWDVLAFDNLSRRGSELNLRRLEEAGVEFVHGDVRDREALRALDELDAVVECSAEPSALAGLDGRTDYVIGTNLIGAYHVLELACRAGAQVIFLSTSRVYPVEALGRVRLLEGESRFLVDEEQELPGVSREGISEAFPLEGW